MDEGHCGLPTEELISLAENLLEVPPELIRTALDLVAIRGHGHCRSRRGNSVRVLAGLYQAERVIADRLVRLLKGKLPWPRIDPDKALPWVEQRSVPVVRLTEVFRQAVQSRDHHQRAQDQSGLHSRSLQARGRQRLLLHAGGRPRDGRVTDR